MRENRLTPFLDPRYKIDGSLEIPLERAKDQLEKHTRYWPMIISQTTIFNMQAVSVNSFNFSFRLFIYSFQRPFLKQRIKYLSVLQLNSNRKLKWKLYMISPQWCLKSIEVLPTCFDICFSRQILFVFLNVTGSSTSQCYCERIFDRRRCVKLSKNNIQLSGYGKKKWSSTYFHSWNKRKRP